MPSTHSIPVESRLVLSVPDAARLVSLPASLLREAIAAGALPVVDSGSSKLRVSRAALEAWIASRERKASKAKPRIDPKIAARLSAVRARAS